MGDYSIPDLTGWEAFCGACENFREARLAQERDASDRTEYFEFVCNQCGSVLLTFQRMKLNERLNEQHAN